jgi:hypothetical protein
MVGGTRGEARPGRAWVAIDRVQGILGWARHGRRSAASRGRPNSVRAVAGDGRARRTAEGGGGAPRRAAAFGDGQAGHTA